MFTLTIKTENAAFHEDDGETTAAMGAEVAAILRRVAEHVENGRDHGRAMDSNGNTVGEWELTP